MAEDIFIDVTPLVDVMLILLLFFLLMVNTPQLVFPVKLPESDSSYKASVKNEEPLKVTIFENDTYAVGKQEYTNIKDVHTAIKEQATGERKVVVIPDKNSKAGNLISFLTFLEGNGIVNVDILIEEGR
jgi:biopolymer transport protein ExbD